MRHGLVHPCLAPYVLLELRVRERKTRQTPRIGGIEGAGPVRGELQKVGNSFELPPPIDKVFLDRFPFEPTPLPKGEIRVLHGQGRQRVFEAFAECRVQCLEFAVEHADRPAVGHDVVARSEQDVVAFASPGGA